MFTTFEIDTITEERLEKEFNRLSRAAVTKDVQASRFEVADEKANGQFTLDVYPEGERSLKYQVGANEEDWIMFLSDPDHFQCSHETLDRIHTYGIRYTLAVSIMQVDKKTLFFTYTPEELMTNAPALLKEVKSLFQDFRDRSVYHIMKDDDTELPF